MRQNRTIFSVQRLFFLLFFFSFEIKGRDKRKKSGIELGKREKEEEYGCLSTVTALENCNKIAIVQCATVKEREKEREGGKKLKLEFNSENHTEW